MYEKASVFVDCFKNIIYAQIEDLYNNQDILQLILPYH